MYLESHFDRFRPEVKERWREQAVPGAGLWVDLGSHLVDQAVQLFGRPDTIQLDTAVLRDGAVVEDYFHAVLRYEAGSHAPLRVVLADRAIAAVESAECVTGPDAKAANSFEAPEVVTARPFTAADAVAGEARLELPPLSVVAATLRLA